MSGKVLPLPSDPRLIQAAQWRVRLSEEGVQSSPAFELWLRDPQNRTAFEQVSVAWDFFGEVAMEPDLLAARQAALGDAFRRAETVRPLRRLAGAAALLLAIGLALGGGAWWVNQPDRYETAHGERRVITLKDGSRISLDADSLVTVRYRRDARLLELRRGQARFDVAKDGARPFSVVAGTHTVVATGTAFNIDMAGPAVLVTLIEGHVMVYDRQGAAIERSGPRPRREIALAEGQQLAVVPAREPVVASVNLQRVTAWTSGQIIFEGEPLGSVVQRINRYGATQIEIADPRVAAMRISGVFNAGDVEGAVRTVSQYLPVHARQLEDGRLLLEAREPVPDAP